MTMRALPRTGAALLLLISAAVHASGDITRGADVHEAQCAECHSLKAGKNKKGPSMFGVMGRKAGTVADVVYTEEMKASGIVWTADKMREYLAGPKAMVPGTKMKYKSKMTPQETEDLLAFLATIK
jgi:cytochrome c